MITAGAAGEAAAAAATATVALRAELIATNDVDSCSL
jgi:hypothetical protein